MTVTTYPEAGRRNLTCVNSPIGEDGKPIFALTVGKQYEATKEFDPPGWKLIGDDGRKIVFFDYTNLFNENLAIGIDRQWEQCTVITRLDFTSITWDGFNEKFDYQTAEKYIKERK